MLIHHTKSITRKYPNNPNNHSKYLIQRLTSIRCAIYMGDCKEKWHRANFLRFTSSFLAQIKLYSYFVLVVWSLWELTLRWKKSQINGFLIKIWLKKCYLHQKCINSCNSFTANSALSDINPLERARCGYNFIWARKLEVKRKTRMRCHFFFWNHPYIVIVTAMT